MIIFVALMTIGYVGARKEFISQQFVKDASKLVMNIFMTATIINSVSAIDTPVSNNELLTVTLAMTATVIICFIVGRIACELTPMDKDKRPVFELLIAIPNSMFIGLPVLQQIYGPTAVFYCAMSCLPHSIIIYTYGIMRMKRGGEGGIRIKDILTPPFIASFIAAFLFFAKLQLPGTVNSFLSILAGATMPMSMLVVGASLGSVSFMAAFKEWRLYIMCLVSLILRPALTLLAVRPFTGNLVLIAAVVVIAACPSGITTSVISVQYDRDSVFSSQGVLLSTAMSMVTIPVMMLLLGVA